MLYPTAELKGLRIGPQQHIVSSKAKPRHQLYTSDLFWNQCRRCSCLNVNENPGGIPLIWAKLAETKTMSFARQWILLSSRPRQKHKTQVIPVVTGMQEQCWRCQAIVQMHLCSLIWSKSLCLGAISSVSFLWVCPITWLLDMERFHLLLWLLFVLDLSFVEKLVMMEKTWGGAENQDTRMKSGQPGTENKVCSWVSHKASAFHHSICSSNWIWE